MDGRDSDPATGPLNGQFPPARTVGDNGRIGPVRPYEIQATKAILQRHIDAGDITQADVNLLNQSYQLISGISSLSTAILGVGTWVYLKRRNPSMPVGWKLLLAGGMGSLGGTIGFAVGGVGAAMEVSSKMPDSQRKMEIFAQIAEESKEAIIEARRGGRGAAPLPNPADYAKPARARKAEDDVWDAEGSREQQAEADREESLRSRVQRASGSGADGGITDRVKKETGGAWDRIRGERPSAQTTQYGQPGSAAIGSALGRDPLAGADPSEASRKDDRSQEQREFDALLEKERQGVSAEETWK